MMHPDSIDDDTCREGIGGGGNGISQLQASASVDEFRSMFTGEDAQKPSGSFCTGFPHIAANGDRHIDTAGVLQNMHDRVLGRKRRLQLFLLSLQLFFLGLLVL
ncbi:MAG: hypothetical protein MK102_03510, partial [Fuerstiella sp.]|nr:hypothetical protein [Fuerstiella sp.]